jgi:hypothetical protein
MNPGPDALIIWLRIAAVAQLAIAVLNVALPRLMRWTEDLARIPLLIREVFYVHAWFISVTLAIFGVMTLRFAGEIAAVTNPVCQWLAGAIGLFWGIRTVLQVAYYSGSHWRGRPLRTALHIALLATYGGLTLVYSLAALRDGP